MEIRGLGYRAYVFGCLLSYLGVTLLLGSFYSLTWAFLPFVHVVF